jgi:membrane peptidoglycan carboxypeptidase
MSERPQRQGERRLDRMFQEIALTIWLSRHWTAEEVLTAYAERVWFGEGLIGLDAAARRYFCKPPEQLAFHEAALLAGLPQSPSRYDPLRRPEQARKRQDFVLGRLRTLGWITEAEWEAARGQPLLPPASMGEEEAACDK